jgi:hypothetical protein
MANALQKLLAETWPNIDLLPVDTTDIDALEQAVKDRRTECGLFEFVWRELNDIETTSEGDIEDALQRMDGAVNDVQAFRAALQRRLG